ncbi:DUF2917 domain-containing protein [Rhodoferax sp.]|uniref:DUF2917 domain-containing protein n=1 Tax=Rhodoferax sp. TaxID=50421 RepID=UPI00374CC9F0
MVKIEQFELRTPNVVVLRLPAGAVIRVSAGCLWLTQDGRAEDVWLQAHGSWTAPQAASLRLSAEPWVDFQIAQPAAARLGQGRGLRLPVPAWRGLPSAA